MPKKKKVNKKIDNGLFEALGPGFGQVGMQFPFNQGAGLTNPVESGVPLFTNLRYYLVSNWRQILSQLYVEIGLVKTIVNVPVDDALRGGVEIKSKQLDEEQIKDLQISADRKGVIRAAGWAAKWARLYGGGGIIIMAGDQDPKKPLNIDRLNESSDVRYVDADMWELFYDLQNAKDGIDPWAGYVDSDFYSYYGRSVHKSRVLRMVGKKAPSFIRPRLRGWGVSEVEALVNSLNQYFKSINLIYEVLDEFKIDIYKIKNLVNTLMSPNGNTNVRNRVAQANLIKNYQHAIVMDSEDEFDHKQLSFAGLAEIKADGRIQIASDMRMPGTKLFGQSFSAGLGNSDQNDIENYNSMLEGEIREPIKYDILRMYEIECQCLFGFIPDDLTLEWKPLRELSAEQQETVREKKFNRLIQARQAGEITTLEFREACNKGNLFDIVLDNAGDALNPDDPEIAELASEGSKPEMEEQPESTEKQNSIPFDKAKYLADGGDSQYDDRKRELYESPEKIDPDLWLKAKEASDSAFGEYRWKFVTWWYEKQGGKFN